MVTLSHKCLDSFLWGQTKIFLVLSSGDNGCNEYTKQSCQKETHKCMYPMCYPHLPRTLPLLDSFLWLLEAILKKKLFKEHETSVEGPESVPWEGEERGVGGAGKNWKAPTNSGRSTCQKPTASTLSVLHLTCAPAHAYLWWAQGTALPPKQSQIHSTTHATFCQQAEPGK